MLDGVGCMDSRNGSKCQGIGLSQCNSIYDSSDQKDGVFHRSNVLVFPCIKRMENGGLRQKNFSRVCEPVAVKITAMTRYVYGGHATYSYELMS
jgi:hypothetical protein